MVLRQAEDAWKLSKGQAALSSTCLLQMLCYCMLADDCVDPYTAQLLLPSSRSSARHGPSTAPIYTCAHAPCELGRRWCKRTCRGPGPSRRNRSSMPLSAVHWVCVDPPARSTSMYISAEFSLRMRWLSCGTDMQHGPCNSLPGKGLLLYDPRLHSIAGVGHRGTGCCSPCSPQGSYGAESRQALAGVLSLATKDPSPGDPHPTNVKVPVIPC